MTIEPPDESEFEISVFGPGVGECVVVHLGGGIWIVVDSCRNHATKRPIALEYLEGIGVDVASAVRLFIVSHWHDDHIRGASDFYTAAESAEFVTSAAMNSREFFTLVSAGKRCLFTNISSGVDEFRYILDSIRDERERVGRLESRGPTWALADRVLLREQVADGIEATVLSLSPSDAALTLSKFGLAEMLDSGGAVSRRAVVTKPNSAAVAVWVKVGEVNVLLGSDLEETPNPSTGWMAVLESRMLSGDKAQIVKVPHHGGRSGFSSRMWDELASRDVIGVVAPKSGGKTYLPKPSDVERLRAVCGGVYLTAPPRGWKSPKRVSAVDRTVREVARNVRAIEGQVGQVRLRTSLQGGEVFSVELFGSAHQV